MPEPATGTLYIAEKPSLGRAIAEGLGIVRRENGFFVCRNYIALSGVDENAVNVVFGDVEYIEKCDSELKFMTSRMTERDIENNIKRLCAFGAEMRSRIRIYE